MERIMHDPPSLEIDYEPTGQQYARIRLSGRIDLEYVERWDSLLSKHAGNCQNTALVVIDVTRVTSYDPAAYCLFRWIRQRVESQAAIDPKNPWAPPSFQVVLYTEDAKDETGEEIEFEPNVALQWERPQGISVSDFAILPICKTWQHVRCFLPPEAVKT